MSSDAPVKVMVCGDQDSPADVILRIHKEKSDLIIKGEKNHEYRKYLLDPEVCYVWLYVNQEATIQYVLEIGDAKVPGEVADTKGVGNVDFNNGLKVGCYGYPIRALYELPVPLTVEELKDVYGVDMANKRQYVKKALVEAFPISTLLLLRSY